MKAYAGTPAVEGKCVVRGPQVIFKSSQFNPPRVTTFKYTMKVSHRRTNTQLHTCISFTGNQKGSLHRDLGWRKLCKWRPFCRILPRITFVGWRLCDLRVAATTLQRLRFGVHVEIHQMGSSLTSSTWWAGPFVFKLYSLISEVSEPSWDHMIHSAEPTSQHMWGWVGPTPIGGQAVYLFQQGQRWRWWDVFGGRHDWWITKKSRT